MPSPWACLLVLFSLLPMLSRQHLGCGQRYLKDPPSLTVVEPTKQDSRLLIHSTPHPLQIFGHFPTTTPANIDIGILRTMFGVASRYYSRVITVTEMAFSSTLYPLSAGTCGMVVPDKYVKEGFDQARIDTVVFIIIESNNSESYVAAASPCIKTRRPIYGYIIFNAAFVKPAWNKPAAFHQNIYITVHQLTHILGFNQQFYAHFYVNPSSSTKLGSERVMKSVGLRKMIITRYVVEFVQEHFGITQTDSDTDEIVGALLEDEGGSGTSFSHWQRKVFMDELMTASDWTPGLRISRLTLSLLKDTGFYYDVDLDMSENITWGRNRGTKFAKAEENSGPEYCQPGSRGCDYYSKYMGYCSNSEPFFSGSYMMLAYLSSICGSPELQNVGPPNHSNSYLTFSADSRCFETGKKVTACYPARCSEDFKVINVTVGSNTVLCTTPDAQMTVEDLTFSCPKNFNVFCAVLSCPNWCNFNGLCIKGKCICNPPYFGQDCKSTCLEGQYFDPEKNICVASCALTKFISPEKVCISMCSNGFVADATSKCIICDSICQHLSKWACAVATTVVALVILL